VEDGRVKPTCTGNLAALRPIMNPAVCPRCLDGAWDGRQRVGIPEGGVRWHSRAASASHRTRAEPEARWPSSAPPAAPTLWRGPRTWSFFERLQMTSDQSMTSSVASLRGADLAHTDGEGHVEPIVVRMIAEMKGRNDNLSATYGKGSTVSATVMVDRGAIVGLDDPLEIRLEGSVAPASRVVRGAKGAIDPAFAAPSAKKKCCDSGLSSIRVSRPIRG